MISSVFEDGELPAPLILTVQKKVECLGMMFGEDTVEHAIAETRALKAKAIALQLAPERSFSCSLVEQSGGLSEFFLSGLSTSHSFSGFSHQNVPDVFSSIYSGGHSRQPSTSQFQLDSENKTAVEEEKTPLFSYLTDILMDENVVLQGLFSFPAGFGAALFCTRNRSWSPWTICD
jgi:hypothetical protein